MLDKLKVITVVGLFLQVLRVFIPSLEVPDDFGMVLGGLVESLYVIIPVVIGWFVPEREATIDGLTPR